MPEPNIEIDPEVHGLIKKALGSRFRMEEGIYCECDEPEVYDPGLMCWKCECRNKDQERKAVDRICNAHDFIPDADFLGGLGCKVCTNWEDNPRHHGIDATPRYSWDAT